jgi:hypothetical protein
MKAPRAGDAPVVGLLYVEEKLREPVRADNFAAATIRALDRHSDAVMAFSC